MSHDCAEMRRVPVWLADRAIEVRQALSARPARTMVSVVAAGLSVVAFLGLTGASRISQEHVARRLDRLRPSFFTVTSNDDAPLFTHRLSSQLAQFARLSGTRGVVALAEVEAPGGGVSPHPSVVPPGTGDGVPILAVSALPGAELGARMTAGREIDAGHVRRGDMVAEVGNYAAADLGLPDLRGRPNVFVAGRAYEVLGVTGPISDAPDVSTGISLPYTAALDDFGLNALDNQRIIVRGQVRWLPLLERLAPYVVRPENPASIEVTALGDPVSLRDDLAAQLSQLVTLVTAAAVLFGAMVVAITSFASVTERHQEFGLRRAVGARTRDIAGFVVAEAALVGVIGGTAGLLVAAAGLAVASAAGSVSFPLAGLELAIAPTLGAAVGVIAGIVPAWAAIRIDPHEALTT